MVNNGECSITCGREAFSYESIMLLVLAVACEGIILFRRGAGGRVDAFFRKMLSHKMDRKHCYPHHDVRRSLLALYDNLHASGDRKPCGERRAHARWAAAPVRLVEKDVQSSGRCRGSLRDSVARMASRFGSLLVLSWISPESGCVVEKILQNNPLYPYISPRWYVQAFV